MSSRRKTAELKKAQEIMAVVASERETAWQEFAAMKGTLANATKELSDLRLATKDSEAAWSEFAAVRAQMIYGLRLELHEYSTMRPRWLVRLIRWCNRRWRAWRAGK